MKIVAYIGTSREETSNTFKVVQALVKQMERDSGVEVEHQIYHPENLTMVACKGTVNCFKGKACPLDERDDTPRVKRAMLEADVIILGSPVRFHHVSGSVKTLMDRTSYWGHLFKLTGKVGLSVSVSSTNGNEYVDYYLDKFHLYQGIHAVKPLSLLMDVLDQEEIDELVREASQAVLTAYRDLKNLHPSQKQEVAFQTFKKMYVAQEGKTSESQYWMNNGLADFETFKAFRDAVLNGEAVKEKTRNLY